MTDCWRGNGAFHHRIWRSVDCRGGSCIIHNWRWVDASITGAGAAITAILTGAGVMYSNTGVGASYIAGAGAT